MHCSFELNSKYDILHTATFTRHHLHHRPHILHTALWERGNGRILAGRRRVGRVLVWWASRDVASDAWWAPPATVVVYRSAERPPAHDPCYKRCLHDAGERQSPRSRSCVA